VAAKFGIEQPVAHGVITPVWAPTGIAIASLVAFGWRLWPGVALGAFVANATSDVSLAVAFGICIGNTLEAVIAAYLLRRSGFSIAMARIRDVIAFVGLAAIVSTAVSATFGVTTLYLGDVVPRSDYWAEWLLWWFGDLIGALLVAPAILVWVSHLRARGRVERVPEGLVLLLILGATSVLIFLGGNWKYPYLIFPLLVWAGLRLRQVGAATAVLVVGAIATWGTVHGSVPIGAATATQSVQILQALLAVVGISILMIAATLSERDVAEAEVEEAYRRTSEAAERLRELDATKNTFISAVAHDLRAPLATISGFSQALLQRLSDFSEDEVRDILERIGGNAERMSRMLANLLDLDRLERGDIEASLVQVDLSDLVLRIVHGLELDREIHVDRGHVMAWVDEVLMERVIENLILNALRHTPQTAAVWIHLARRPNGAEISVEDEGPGVPDEQKQLIFEAFKRGGNGAAVGTGLGLFLVTRFSELHGGKAWVEDRPGGGAVFRVFVPDRQGGTPERKVVTEPPEESSSVGQRRS
jgi:signal transduction histidine kinase